MEKKHLLIITANTTAKIGMLSYLSSIFHNHLILESSRVSDVTPDLLAAADCLLYTTKAIRAQLHEQADVPDTVHELVCTRTFNHTYLNKILQIPLGSFVYVVNDFESSTYGVIHLLREFGFSQYHFLPYYPGCGPINPDVHYAITPGETHLVPPGIPHVINIGIRVPDISTIHAVITLFHLPGNLADEITRNYISHIVQTLKISHRQLSQAIDARNVTQTILNNITNGVCLTDQEYRIIMANPAFYQALGIPQYNPHGDNLNLLLQEYHLPWDPSASSEYHFLNIRKEPVRLWIQEVDNFSHTRMFLIHADLCGSEEPSSPALLSAQTAAHNSIFSSFTAHDPAMARMLRAARRLSLTDYPILIQGGSSSERESLARSIHNNSRRKTAPFLVFSPASIPAEDLIAPLSGYYAADPDTGAPSLKHGILSMANHGTLFIQGAELMSPSMQEYFLQVLQKNSVLPKGGAEEIPVNFRLILSSGADLYEQVRSHAFNGELFFSLCVAALEIPPLKNRPQDAAAYMDFLQKSLFSRVSGQSEDVFSPALRSFLETYSWPGNAAELQNLFQYLSCIYDNSPLELEQLPPYLLRQAVLDNAALSVQEHWILSIIQSSPKIGRSSIQKQLEARGVQLTEGKIRTILQSLARQDYIRVHRTKGGCEITSLGQMMLQAASAQYP